MTDRDKTISPLAAPAVSSPEACPTPAGRVRRSRRYPAGVRQPFTRGRTYERLFRPRYPRISGIREAPFVFIQILHESLGQTGLDAVRLCIRTPD